MQVNGVAAKHAFAACHRNRIPRSAGGVVLRKVPACALFIALAAWTAFAATPAKHMAPMFPTASDPQRQGFVRIINHSTEPGEVRVEAIDDTGERFGPVTLAIGGDETVHFNSDDLETGNPDKGLSGSTGAGSGDWRLEFSTVLDIEVLSYIRTTDGFLTAMHDVAPATGKRHRVAVFNPGDNVDQVSRLRLINPGEEEAEITIRGVDGNGDSPGSDVRTTVAAGASRTFTAAELESGGFGLEGALGDGVGKWQLDVASDQPIRTMSLLESPTGHLTNLSTAPRRPAEADRTEHRVPFFPSASDAQRQGFARVVNHSREAGEVRIDAIDDIGREFGPLTLAIDGEQTAHFNSNDLEFGNTGKRLTGSAGAGYGDWRLEMSSELDIEVFGYVRTTDGFLTAMHDIVPLEGNRHRVAMFNPGSNTDQESRLRLVNLGDAAAKVVIRGIDGDGAVSQGVVPVSIIAGGARTLTAQELESLDSDLAGNLDDGAGKWRLTVESEPPLLGLFGLASSIRVPILAMSLLESPAGHLTNLSTAPRCADDGAFRDPLASGGTGPEMAVVPAGRFRMGCLSGDDCADVAKPVHEVTIAQAFALSKTEVTFGDWDACVSDGGCNGYRPPDRYWGRFDRPVIYVDQEDAQSYVSWLAAQTGASYRLPSEAEWEYAARAGSETKHSWGDGMGEDRANCAGCGGRWDALDSPGLFLVRGGTAPVGSFAANAFCLHDMHGNVGEWVADWWNETYAGAPGDGSAWLSGDSLRPLVRGGFWATDLIGSGARGYTTDRRSAYVGFRVARTLSP